MTTQYYFFKINSPVLLLLFFLILTPACMFTGTCEYNRHVGSPVIYISTRAIVHNLVSNINANKFINIFETLPKWNPKISKWTFLKHLQTKLNTKTPESGWFRNFVPIWINKPEYVWPATTRYYNMDSITKLGSSKFPSLFHNLLHIFTFCPLYNTLCKAEIK
jgi:hypothetical protein